MDLRALPSVDAVLSSRAGCALCARFPHAAVAAAVRRAIDQARAAIRDPTHADGAALDLSPDGLATRAGQTLEQIADAGPPAVVNATGVVVHTNLGRAPLGRAAIEALVRAASRPSALELDLANGGRGERDRHVVPLLCDLTGAEDALVVNNNAAALLLAVDTLADRREVLVSRGELIEIGGSFRLPDVLRKGGAVLREVGTTNRTRIEDFAAAICRRTALVLRAHPSNYRIEGFTERPPLAALVELAHARGVPVVEDLGSGALVDLARWGLPREPTPADSIAAGVDLVTFSGDKLLGGPQAGIAVGRAPIVHAMRANPLRRALRVDKLATAALAATLADYRTALDLPGALPVLGLLARPIDAIERLGERSLALLRTSLPAEFSCELVSSDAEVGSGAQPAAKLASRAIAVAREGWAPERVAAYFRDARPPILGRIARARFLLDLRAVETAEDLVPRRAAEAAR